MSLGAQWVVAHADDTLARAALDVLAKIAAIVPEQLRQLVDEPAVGTPPTRNVGDEAVDLPRLREWSRRGLKLKLRYVDDAGTMTDRTVRPFLGTSALAQDMPTIDYNGALSDARDTGRMVRRAQGRQVRHAQGRGSVTRSQAAACARKREFRQQYGTSNIRVQRFYSLCRSVGH